MHEDQTNAEDNEIVLRPSKKRAALNLFVCLGFVIVGAILARHEARIIGWLSVLFFGLCTAVFVLQFLPNASYLRIRRDGFRFCSLFRQSPLILWRDVSDFRVARVPPTGHRIVVFDWQAAPNRNVRRINRHLVDASDGLPDSYGLRPEELADLLNAWRSRATLHT
jgi:hypothetical protein